MSIALFGASGFPRFLAGGALILLVHCGTPALGQSNPAASPPPHPRKTSASPEVLLQQLAQSPEINLAVVRKQFRGPAIGNVVLGTERPTKQLVLPAIVSENFQAERWQSLGLEPRRGAACKREAEVVLGLAEMSAALRKAEAVTNPARPRPLQVTDKGQFDQLPIKLGSDKELVGQVTALIQMLQVEDEPSRLLLVELLTKCDTADATAGLAQRALYDHAAEVRAKAIAALADRPRESVRKVLLDGLRYPWPPVADRAAEAIVALRDPDAVPRLRALVDEPDPTLPIVRPEAGRRAVVREMVRVNHLRNCLLCHAPAEANRESLVAAIPVPGSPLVERYYAERSLPESSFVRADITYLRQDFSLIQRVEDAAPWPEKQRFDFLVRERDATAEDLIRLALEQTTYPQREAVLWALKELEK